MFVFLDRHISFIVLNPPRLIMKVVCKSLTAATSAVFQHINKSSEVPLHFCAMVAILNSVLVSVIVFLQYRGETKRAIVEENDRTAVGIRCLFVRTFLNLSSFHVSQEGVKIYIQDAAKPEVFYELEDFKYVINLCVKLIQGNSSLLCRGKAKL